MSMPSFPPCGADMTKDEALTMIIASIAMEELALSHIVNAEGEKLQYILGTLPDNRPESCADYKEILTVNNSVRGLLDTVLQSQMLLKGKLERALEASGHSPEPHCPCKPPHDECSECKKHREKSAIRLTTNCCTSAWESGSLLCWRCRTQRGKAISWDESSPAKVRLDTNKIYALEYTINVKSIASYGSVAIKINPSDAFSDTLPLWFSPGPTGCETTTLHYSAVLFPQSCKSQCANLSLLLNCGGSILVEQASMSIVEL